MKNPPFPPLGMMPASRKIKKLRTHSVGARGYVHDLDPYTFHATKDQATKDRSRLFNLPGMNAPIKSRMQRETTIYSIFQDKRKSGSTKFGRTPQGPHVIPNWGIHHALAEAKRTDTLHQFPVLTPAKFENRLSLEIPNNHAKRPKAELAVDQYRKNYKTYSSLKKRRRDEAQNIKFAHTINKLMQLDPYGTYSYKSGGAKKSSLKGKGESSALPIGPQIDRPKTPFFDHAEFSKHVQDMVKTLGKFGVK